MFEKEKYVRKGVVGELTGKLAKDENRRFVVETIPVGSLICLNTY